MSHIEPAIKALEHSPCSLLAVWSMAGHLPYPPATNYCYLLSDGVLRDVFTPNSLEVPKMCLCAISISLLARATEESCIEVPLLDLGTNCACPLFLGTDCACPSISNAREHQSQWPRYQALTIFLVPSFSVVHL